MKILVTGARGIVGTGLREELAQDHTLRLSMRAPSPECEGYEVVAGDITDPAVIESAVEGVDAILHLAASHGEAITFEETLDVNYRGLVAVMDAAVRHGVGQVIYTSSNHGWGFWPRSSTPLAETAPPRPDGWYGVSKIFGEAVMAYYGDAHGLSTTSLRIGNCGSEVPDERRRHMWISFRDLARLIGKVLERRTPGHAALFATAPCEAPFFDNSGLARHGFECADHPDDHLADPSIRGAAPVPGIAGLAVGGGYAEANFAADIDKWKSGE